MEITCPYTDCGKKFFWEPSKDTVTYKVLDFQGFEEKEEKKPRRYVATCPYCKREISVHVNGEPIWRVF